ncbi:WD40 repeat-like protein [Artomyces pyxidatus]|uniref:WD40 repeat-like protein n=1 Tax=Artomyces pyxidatus TaxID=48021 RepID=A0ACB8SGW0_9AGAM|nr:WD40 repeat-like protein [Artomyces pyxidatus]
MSTDDRSRGASANVDRLRLFGRHNFVTEEPSFVSHRRGNTNTVTREPFVRRTEETALRSGDNNFRTLFKTIAALGIAIMALRLDLHLNFTPIPLCHSIFGVPMVVRLAPRGYVARSNTILSSPFAGVSINIGPVSLQAQLATKPHPHALDLPQTHDTEPHPLDSDLVSSVILNLTSSTYSPPLRWDISVWTRLLRTKQRTPNIALSPDVGPGDCWPFAGSNGTLGIGLSAPAIITGVTIRHATVSTVSHVSSAPRSMVLWGVVDAREIAGARCDNRSNGTFPEYLRDTVAPGHRVIPLLEAEYGLEGAASQRFNYKKKLILSPNHASSVTSVAISRDGTHLASASLDGKVFVFAIQSGERLHEFIAGTAVVSLVWPKSDSSVLLFGCDDGTLVSVALQEDEIRTSRFQAHFKPLEYLSPVVDSPFLASAARDEVKVWGQMVGSDGKEHWLTGVDIPPPPSDVAHRQDPNVAISIHWLSNPDTLNHDSNGVLLVAYLCWNLRSLSPEWRIAHRGCGAVDLSPNRQTLAVHAIPQATHFDIYDVKSRSKIRTVEVEESLKSRPLPVRFLHDGFALLGGSYAGNIRIWDIDSGDRLQVLRHGDCLVQALAPCYVAKTDTFLIATGTAGGEIFLWDAVPTVQALRPISGWQSSFRLTLPPPLSYCVWLFNILLVSFLVLVLAKVWYFLKTYV